MADLSGDWQFAPGDDSAWADPSFDDGDWEVLHAPALWDDQGYAEYDGFGWYRRRFTVPDGLDGRQFVFEHGGVDDDDWVYVNGTEIGLGKGCYQPRSYLVPSGLIRAGEWNLIAVRIYDGAMGGGLATGPIRVREAALSDEIKVTAVTLTGEYGQDTMELRFDLAAGEGVPGPLKGSYRVWDYFGRACAAGDAEIPIGSDGAASLKVAFRGTGCTDYRARLVLRDGERAMDVFRYLTVDARTETRGVLNLSGEWEMLAPPGDRLAFPPAGQWAAFQVPTRSYGGWEGQNHAAWFRRSFTVPSAFQGDRLKLRFEAVAHFAQVYVNGRKLAEHLGGYEPFEVDVTAAVRRDGPNEVLVGVRDWTAGLVEGVEPWDGRQEGPRDSALIPFGTRPISRRGIWDDVYLMAHANVAIADVFPITSVREKSLSLQVTVRNEGGVPREVTLQNAVFDGTERVLGLPQQSVTIEPGRSQTVRIERAWPSPRLWWPHDPHLYRLHTELIADGQVLDALDTRFGFREFWIDGTDYRLNGLVFKLRGLVCPPTGASREEIRDYYLRAAESNFSLVRFHMQPRSHYYYDIADELGMCVKDESAFYCAASTYALADERLWQNLQAHVRGMVLRSRAHPSLCVWSVENEILHCGGVRDPNAGARIYELGRLIADLDPSRPIEYEGDGDVEGRADTVNIHYPREFGCHKHNLWPNDAYWLGREGNDRWPRDLVWQKDKPLIMGEFCYYPYSRPPGGVSVFGGDRVYVSKEDEQDAHVQGVKFLCDAARRLGVAGLNPWVSDWRYSIECLKPIAVTFAEYDSHFYAGETVARSLMVHNDTLAQRRLTLACSVKDGRRVLQDQEWEIELEPGGMREVPLSWTMPDADERRDVLLDVRLLSDGQVVFEERRTFAAFPKQPLAVPDGLRVALYDPQGETDAALRAAGLTVARVAGLSDVGPFTCDLLLIGKGALQDAEARGALTQVADAVASGMVAFCFEQRDDPDWLPVRLRVDGEHASTIAFRRSTAHAILKGIEDEDLKFWRGDHMVSRRNFVKPAAGAYRILVEAGGLGGLRWAPLVEVPHGRGTCVLSQLVLTEKLASEPVAVRLLQNVMDYAASYRPAPARRIALVASADPELGEFLARIGVRSDDLSHADQGADLSGYGLLIIGRDDSMLGQAARLQQFAGAGGKVLIHCPTAESQEALKALIPAVRAVKACRPRGRLVKRRDDGLMEGLSNSDFFWYREDCWWRGWEGGSTGSGLIQSPAAWQVLLEKDAGVIFTRPPAVVSVPCGAGEFVINTIRWDDADPAVADKATRIASTLVCSMAAP